MSDIQGIIDNLEWRAERTCNASEVANEYSKLIALLRALDVIADALGEIEKDLRGLDV